MEDRKTSCQASELVADFVPMALMQYDLTPPGILASTRKSCPVNAFHVQYVLRLMLQLLRKSCGNRSMMRLMGPGTELAPFAVVGVVEWPTLMPPPFME